MLTNDPDAVAWLEAEANWPRRNAHGCFLYNFRDDVNRSDNPEDDWDWYDQEPMWHWDARPVSWPHPHRPSDRVEDEERAGAAA